MIFDSNTTPRIYWIVLFLSLFLISTLISNYSLDLALDEAYYWYWSKHLDWSYFDHPPMIAYLTAVTTWLGGDNEFFVRLGALLSVLSGFVFVYFTVQKLFPDETANLGWEVLFILNLTLIFAGIATVHTIDSPLLLFWMAAVFCGSAIVADGKPIWWYWWGVSLGLGLLSKYTMILIVPCQFLFLLSSRRHRFWLLRKEPYIALAIALLVFSPVLFWNWQHHWVSFLFQLNQGLSENEESSIVKLLAYLGTQAGISSPSLFVAFVVYSTLGLYLSVKTECPPYLYLLLHSWPVILFFGATSLLGERAEGNWPAPAYVTGLIVMWVVFRRHYAGLVEHRIFIGAMVAIALLVNLLIRTHLLVPILPVATTMDPLKGFHSWSKLGEIIDSYIANNPHPEGYFLVSDSGTRVAEAVFYTGNRYLGVDFFRPERYLFLESADEQLRGKDAIILGGNDPNDITRYAAYFRSVEAIGFYEHIYRGKTIQKYSHPIFRGEGYLGNWAQLNPISQRYQR